MNDASGIGPSQFAHIPRTHADDHDGWMAMFSMLDDHEVDALLAGTSPVDGDLAPVAEVVRALRRMADREPVPPMSGALRAQGASPPVVPIGLRRATRAALMQAAAAAAVVALVGVGAAQNRLPADVQDIVSSTADLVDVDVPRSEERHADDVGSGQGGSEGTGNANDGTPGYDGVMPGGTDPADPADPGDPGDHEPATPATPATPPAGNQGGGASNEEPRSEQDPSTNANPNSQTNDTGRGGSTNSNPNGTDDPEQDG